MLNTPGAADIESRSVVLGAAVDIVVEDTVDLTALSRDDSGGADPGTG